MKRLILIVLLILAVWLTWEWLTFPDVALLKTDDPKTTAFMERRKAQLRREGKSDELSYRFVPYGRISSTLRRAVLVAEDNAFYEHEGVDVEGLKEALRKDWEKKRLTAGGSTITQQLAKNLYLSPSRNPVRKIKEYFIARSLEQHLSKKRILEIYLNVAEFGERTYGAEAAARHYFGKSAASLTAPEAALLAGSLPNPRRMNPDNITKRLRARQRMILSRMKRWGYLVERETLTETRPAEDQTSTADRTDSDLQEDAATTATDSVSESTPEPVEDTASTATSEPVETPAGQPSPEASPLVVPPSPSPTPSTD